MFENQFFENGLISKTTMPNAVVVDQLFDVADRLVSRVVHKNDLAMTTLSAWTGIAYDDDDQRTAETVTQAQPTAELQPVKAGDATYAYDSLGRLVSAKHPFEPDTAHYTLDDGGNVVKDPDATFTFTKNRLSTRSSTVTDESPELEATRTTVESSVYEYDNFGNQSQELTTVTSTYTTPDDTFTTTDSLRRTYAYDAGSHPTRVASNDGSWVDYAYDALGRLTRRVEHPVSGSDVMTLFFHDGAGDQVAVETDGTGSMQVRYVLDSEGDPVGQDMASSRSYYVQDPRGNLTQQLDVAQGVVAVYAYDAYGGERKAHTKAPSN